MKLKIISLSLVIVVIFLSSCKKEDLVVSPKTNVHLISKLEIADQPYSEYIYNFADLLSEEMTKFIFINYHYNTDNKLSATNYSSNGAFLSNDPQVFANAINQAGLLSNANTDMEGSVRYEYNNGGQLFKTIVSSPPNSSPEYSEFSYDGNNRIGKQTLYWDNEVSGYIDYLYDERGNLIKETLYSVLSSELSELMTTTQYEFDNYKNPYESFNRLAIPGINTNPNNIIKETNTIHINPDQGNDIVQITLISYIYDSNGYPVRKNGSVEFLYK